MIPGIDASNIEAIFEEHTVVSRVDPFAPRRCQYAREERLFDFGTMLAALGGQAEGASAGVRANLKMVNPTKVSLTSAGPSPHMCSVTQDLLSFSRAHRFCSSWLASAGLTRSAGPGVMHSFPATRHQGPGSLSDASAETGPVSAYPQVQATVNFTIKPSGAPVQGPFPMEVQPPQLVLPPNEARYVTLSFSPVAIRSYAATFEAAVEGGSHPATKAFSCELRGEGTLPSMSVELPGAEKGAPAIKFARLLKVRLPVSSHASRIQQCWLLVPDHCRSLQKCVSPILKASLSREGSHCSMSGQATPLRLC